MIRRLLDHLTGRATAASRPMCRVCGDPLLAHSDMQLRGCETRYHELKEIDRLRDFLLLRQHDRVMVKR